MHLRTHDQSKLFVMSQPCFNKSLNQWDYTYLVLIILWSSMYVTSYCLCFCSIIFPYPPLASSLQFSFSGIEIVYHQYIFCSKIWFLKLVIFFLASLHRYQCWKEVSWVCHQARSQLSHLEYLQLSYFIQKNKECWFSPYSQQKR